MGSSSCITTAYGLQRAVQQRTHLEGLLRSARHRGRTPANVLRRPGAAKGRGLGPAAPPQASGATQRTASKRPLHELYMVTARIQNESNVVRFAILWSLEERDAELLKLLAHRAQVVHQEANVAEALRVSVAVMHLEVSVLLRAVVVSELQRWLPQTEWQPRVLGATAGTPSTRG